MWERTREKERITNNARKKQKESRIKHWERVTTFADSNEWSREKLSNLLTMRIWNHLKRTRQEVKAGETYSIKGDEINRDKPYHRHRG